MNGFLASASRAGNVSSFVSTANGSYVIPGAAVVTDSGVGGGGGSPAALLYRRTQSSLGTRIGSRQAG